MRLPLSDGYVDLDTGSVHRAGTTRSLSTRERLLLRALAEPPGAIHSRDALQMAAVDDDAGPRAVDYAIRRLRKKLEADPAAPRHLVAVHGEGYRFVIATTPPAAPAPPIHETVRVGPWSFDHPRRQLTHPDGRQVALTPKEAGVLQHLWSARGAPVSRARLQAEVWGERRRSTLRYVDAVVLRLRRKLDGVRIETVSAVGYRLDVPRPAHVRPPGPFVGRADLVARVEAALRDAGVVALVGPGGIGKTRLAREILADHAGDAWFCALDTCAGAADVVATVARSLEVAPDPERLAHALAALGPGLVVLDNAETVAADLGPWLARWRAGAPELRWLVTTRVAADLPADHVVPVPPLALDDAVALFRASAEAAGAPPLPDAVLPEVRALCARLDALPLAVELTSRRAPVWSVPELAAQVDRAGPLARSLSAALDATWASLGPDARRALAACAVFRGGFTRDAFTAVAGQPATVLEELVAWSVVRTVQTVPVSRFDLLQTVRDAVVARSDPRDARARHAGFFADAAGRHWRRAHAEARPDARAWLRTEQGNLEAAVRWLSDHRPTDAATVVLALEPVLWAQDGWLRFVALARAVPRPLPPVLEGWLSWAEGRALLGAGRLADALAALDRAAAEPHDDPLLDADIGNTRGFTRWRTGDREGSSADLARARDAAERSGSDLRLAAVLSTQGTIAGYDDAARAEALFLEALAWVEESGDPHEEARIRSNFGNFRLRHGRVAEAEALHREALALHHGSGSRLGALMGHVNLGNVAFETADSAGAQASWQRALELARRLGHRTLQAAVLFNLGMALAEQGQVTPAEVAVRRALALHRSYGERNREARDQALLGLLAERAGRLDDAEAWLVPALETLEAVGMVASAGHAALTLAIVRAQQGRFDAAAAQLAAARRLLGHHPPTPAVLAWAEATVGVYEARAHDTAPPAPPARPERPTFALRWSIGRFERALRA